ncbi:MAG: hypothetical protein IPP22_14805, partial [Nitrosomonas sp.]|nr:hypothetical protein [Nitrosomonas sp.]
MTLIVPAAAPPEEMVRTIFLAKAAALMLTVSDAAPADTFIDVAADPVVMLIPLSAALAVVIVSIPLRFEAKISPTKLLITSDET